MKTEYYERIGLEIMYVLHFTSVFSNFRTEKFLLVQNFVDKLNAGSYKSPTDAKHQEVLTSIFKK